MAKRKTRVSLNDMQKANIKKLYKTKADLKKLAKKYDASTSTIGRIVGVYKTPVWEPKYAVAKRKRGSKIQKALLSNGLSQLQSYLDGLREGIIVRVADTPAEKEKLSKYINGWDDCAQTILQKIKEFL